MSEVASGRIVHLAESGVAHIGPCFLLSYSASSTGASKIATVYAGLNTNGRKIGLMNLAANGYAERRFASFILCPEGVYVDLTDTAITADLEIIPAHKGPSPS
jgi:hypothetical protein